ncbi:MAG: hypothetical protein PVI68_19145 [Anaerolineae bacterium]|jgi:hypothetical protein
MLGIRKDRVAGVLVKLLVALVLLVLSAMGASAKGRGPVIHHVSVGGPDACLAWGENVGCDRNYSMVVTQYADGSVSGQLSDNSPYLAVGIHAVIDCLVVDGNEAWVSGVITKGALLDGTSLVGGPIGARLRDNGVNAYDAADQISFTEIEAHHNYAPCTERPDYELFDAPQGQVKVR